MRTALVVAVSILLFIGFNYTINNMQKVKRDGDAFYFRLRPDDPRSLIQGDYMQLSYSIEQAANHQIDMRQNQRGDIVFGIDPNGVAYFIRIYHGELLAPGEHLIPFRVKFGSAHLIFDRYYMQESQEERYASAVFGVIKCLEGDRCLLAGLADQDKVNL